jgi:hypothetical protein
MINKMKLLYQLIKSLPIAASIVALTTLTVGGVAQATSTSTGSGSSAAAAATATQTKIANIISKGNQEINRRLATLNTLSTKISSTTKLTSDDQATLSSEVNSEISGLTSLKSSLDAQTTLAGAISDAQSIISGYRVYALVVPKVMLIKTADDQQAVEAKLTTLAQKLQTRISAAQTKGTNVTTLQADLSDMTTMTAAAQNISSSMEQTVLVLEPTDYDSDHAVLAGDGAQLQTAHSDNVAAYNDAKNIVSALQSM